MVEVIDDNDVIDEAGLALLEDELTQELEDEDIDRSDSTAEEVSVSILSDDGHLPNSSNPSQSIVSVYKKSKKERRRKIAELLALRQKRKKTQTVDIFSLGCVFFYVLVSRRLITSTLDCRIAYLSTTVCTQNNIRRHWESIRTGNGLSGR